MNESSRGAQAEQLTRINQRLQARVVQLSALNEIGQLVSQQLELDQLLEIVYTQVKTLLQVDAFFVALYDAPSRMISYPLVYDEERRYQEPPSLLSPSSNTYRVIQSGRPLVINRTPQEMEAIHIDTQNMMANTEKVPASLLYVPLCAGPRVVGAISVQSYHFDVYDEEDGALLTSVAGQVAIAVENARLFEQTRSALADTESLYLAGAELNAAQTYDDALDVLRARTLLGQADCSLSLDLFDRPWNDQDRPEWVEVAARWSNLPSDAFSPRYAVRDFPSAEKILRADEPTIIADVTTDPRLGDDLRELIAQRLGARAAVFAPLVVAGQWIGWVNGVYSQPTEFSEAEVRRLMSLVGQAAVAVQSISRLEAAQTVLRNIKERDRFSTSMAEIASELLRRGPDAISESLAQVGQAAAVSRVYIFENFWDDDDGLCMRQTHEWVTEGIVSQIDNKELQHLPYDSVLPRWKKVLGQGEIISGQVRDFPATEREILEPQEILSILVIPIFVGDEFYGFVGLDDCVHGRGWSALEIDLLQTISGSIAAAVESRSLFDEMRASQQRYLDLYNQAPDCYFSLGPDGTLVDINETGLRWFGYERDELVGHMRLLKLLVPSDRPVFQQNFPVLKERGYLSDVEVTFQRQDGSTFAALVNATAVYDDEGNFVSSRTILRDVTVLKTAQSERDRLLMNVQSHVLQLQTAAEVSRATTSILDIDQLLDTSVNLIRDRFGYYYVGLFLMDTMGEWVVLRAGTGEAGRAMLEQEHSLEVGGNSMIGQSVALGEPRIALDVGKEAVRFDNPHLPLTRSEMALPLVSRGEVLGALTVQSTEEAAFTQEDITVLRTLADQIANALTNARQFELVDRARAETDKRVQELDCLNDIGHRMEESPPLPELLSWMAMRIPPAMLYAPHCLVAIEYRGQTFGPSEAKTLPWQIVQSLHVGGEPAGRIYIAYTEEHAFLDEESALLGDIVRRVSSYIESRWLFEQAQTARAEAEGLYQSSIRMGAAQNYDQVVEALQQHDLLRQVSRGSVGLFNRPWLGDDMPEWVEEVACWAAPGLELVTPVGSRVELKDHAALQHFHPDRPFIIENVAGDPRVDDNTRRLYLETFAAQSVFFIPLTVGGQWIGWFNALGEQPTSFPKAQIRQLMALASQVAVTVQSLRRLKEIQDHAGREQALRRVMAVINASQNLVADLPDLTLHIGELAPVDVLTLALYVPGEPEYTLFAVGAETEAGHFARQGVRLPVKGTASGWAISHQEVWLDEDFRQEKRFIEDEQLAAEGLASRLILPLLAGGQVVGTLNLGSSQPGAYTQEHASTLGQVADGIALALERARLLEETRTALEQVQAVHRRYLRESWQSYLSSRRRAAQPAYLYDKARVVPLPGSSLAGMELALGKEPPTGGNTQESGRVLFVPISLRGQPIGMLAIEPPPDGRAWNEEEIALVEAVSTQLALALDNARLFEQTQYRAGRERLTREITDKIRGQTDLDTILQTTLAELGKVLGTSRAAIRLGTEAELTSSPSGRVSVPAQRWATRDGLPDQDSRLDQDSRPDGRMNG